MTNALVTGAGGYIGTRLTARLLEADIAVRGLDRYFFGRNLLGPTVLSHPKFSLLQSDIRDVDERHFEDIDVVFDLAGLSNDASGELDPTLTNRINRAGSLRVAEMAKAAGVPRYVFASSCAVYGLSGEGVVDEQSPLNPVSAYARAKAEVEPELLALAEPNFCVTLLRNATVYGLSPRMRFDLAVNVMTFFAWEEGRILVRGGGKQWRPFVSIEDVVGAMLAVADADPGLVNGEIFNVGSDDQNFRIDRLSYVIKQTVEEYGKAIQLEVVPEDSDHRSYQVAFEKIGDVLGWQTSHSVEASVRAIYEALEERRVDPSDPRTITVTFYLHLLECERLLTEVGRDG